MLKIDALKYIMISSWHVYKLHVLIYYKFLYHVKDMGTCPHSDGSHGHVAHLRLFMKNSNKCKI